MFREVINQSGWLNPTIPQEGGKERDLLGGVQG